MPLNETAQGAGAQQPPPVTTPNVPPVFPNVPNVPMALSLGMIANTVDSFSGKERVEEYFEKIELRSKLDNWDKATTLTIVKFRLSGEAYRFLKSEPSLEAATISYEEFKKRFIKRFSPIRIPGEALLKLGKCFQRHDESIANYVTRLKLLGSEILKEDYLTARANEKEGLKKKRDELVLHQFKVGVKKEYLKNLGPLLMRTDDLTIDQAENFARQEELNTLMLNNRQSASSSVFTVKCFRCGRPNHYANECRNQRNFTDPARYNNQQNFSGNQNYRSPPRQFASNDQRLPVRNQNWNSNRPPNNNFNNSQFQRFNNSRFQNNLPSQPQYTNQSAPRQYNNSPRQLNNNSPLQTSSAPGNVSQVHSNNSLNVQRPPMTPQTGGN